MCNTYSPGGNTGETNRLITATLSRSRQLLWEAESWELRNVLHVLISSGILTCHLTGSGQNSEKLLCSKQQFSEAHIVFVETARRGDCI